MRRLTLLTLIFSISLFAKDRPEVTTAMQQAFNALMNLQPYLVSSEKFKDPKSKAAILKDLETMSKLKHMFPKKMEEEEPGAKAIVGLFGEYLKDVQNRYKSGDFEYARNRMRTTSGFCFGCHTRLTAQTNFTDFSRKVENSDLTPFQRAEIFAATRQFDKALALYSQVLAKTPKDELGMIEVTRGLRHALSISVRVKKNPEQTMKLLDSVTGRKDLPEFVQSMVMIWKKDVKAWMEEKEGSEQRTGEELVAKAKLMIERASSLQAFPADEYGDISYLRASTYLHEALDNNPKGKWRGEALYYLGLCYYSLQDPMLWDLENLYYEACIKEFPKSDISKKCYRKYADKIYLGYTGSGGTNIPEDELTKLKELRKLAE